MNPHYFGDNAQGLADALKANLTANTQVGATHPFTIKVYDAQKPAPNFPLAQAQSGTGFSNTATPREICLCLSYYSTWNRPRYRGRMYIPGTFVGGSFGQRPTSLQRDNALAWGQTFGKNLPAQHNWVVYSRRNDEAYGVNHIWVDDEWDIIRSRGLRPTTRTEGTIP